MVRLHLEYTFQVWYLHLAADISSIERIQRRATKILYLSKKKLTINNERLKIMNLTTLKERRSREDLIYMYKIARGHEKINWENIKSPINRETKSHNFRFHRESFKTKRKNDHCHFVTLKSCATLEQIIQGSSSCSNRKRI